MIDTLALHPCGKFKHKYSKWPKNSAPFLVLSGAHSKCKNYSHANKFCTNLAQVQKKKNNPIVVSQVDASVTISLTVSSLHWIRCLVGW